MTLTEYLTSSSISLNIAVLLSSPNSNTSPILKLLYSNTEKREKNFEDFRKKYINIIDFKDIKKLDKVIVGSDQVWNPSVTNLDSRYFLDFVSEDKRYSYAASFGSKIDDKYKEIFKENLQKFNKISVRENCAKEELNELISQNVDVVIAVGHQDDRYNESLANLSGLEKIDAIINSHSHETYSSVIIRNDGSTVPYLQAGSAGEKFGQITLGINTETKEVTGGFAQIKNSNGKNIDPDIDLLIYKLQQETAPIFSRVIGVAKQNVYRNECATWAASALREYAGTDIAVINSGGIRTQGLPIYKGSNITISTVHGFMPFDNIVKTVTLKGSDIKRLVSMFVYSSNVVYNESTGQIYINGELLQTYKKYTVASIDYIFDNSKYPFLYGENINNTGVLFRDVLIERIEKDGSIIL